MPGSERWISSKIARCTARRAMWGMVGLTFTPLVGCGHAPPRESGFNPPVGSLRAEVHSEPPLAFARTIDAPPGAPDQVGLATWYGRRFAGRKTANGERFDPTAMTAAHRTLPMGTWVEVRRVDTHRAVRVRINDRGPWGDSRKVIDLSQRAAELLDILQAGVMKVELRVVRGPE